jgi:hypothetical protein
MGRKGYNQLEIGRTGVKHSYGYMQEEFLSVLQGKNGIKVYKEMSDNDPIIGAFMHAIKQIFREARWEVKSPKGASTKDEDLLRDAMYEMEHSWNDFISDAITFAIYGWSWFEQVFFRDEFGRFRWSKLAFRAQDSLERWEIDEYGETLGMYQRPAPNYTEYYIPKAKSIHFVTEHAGGNPESRSILRNAYRPYYFKRIIEEIEGIGIERDLTGLPHLTLPEGLDMQDDDPKVTEAINAAKRILTNIRRDEQDGILTPHGWEFELISSPGQRQFDTVSVINRYNKEIAVTVLAQFIMLGMERTGSYALAEEQTDMFYLCLEGWLDSLATAFNRQAVPLLYTLNGVTNKQYMPYIVHTPIRRFTLKEFAEYVNKLSGVDAITVDDETRNFFKRYARIEEYAERRK